MVTSMNHDSLKAIIYDQHEVIRNVCITPRRYTLDPEANYIVTGVRRAGKSTLLYSRVLELVASGVSWDRIIYINFEDERLAEFRLADFNDILQVQAELSEQRGYFFFDEIQNIEGWEKFARRLSDYGERVCITGSNAKMLSSQMEAVLGGRYLTQCVTPYRFDEYLDAVGIAHDQTALASTKSAGRIISAFEKYLVDGGFPESLRHASPRQYVESVYQKVLLGDIAARNNVRSPQVLRVLMKKIAETVCSEVSYSSLHGMLKGIGYSVSKDTVISYIDLARESYLLFGTKNFAAKFAEREGSPRYYFSDNALLSLFLDPGDSALLENEVAVALKDEYGDDVHYLHSRRTGIDVDFYMPEAGLAIQVATELSQKAQPREIGNLLKLAKSDSCAKRLVVVTKGELATIEEDGASIEVVPAWRFLLHRARSQK